MVFLGHVDTDRHVVAHVAEFLHGAVIFFDGGSSWWLHQQALTIGGLCMRAPYGMSLGACVGLVVLTSTFMLHVGMFALLLSVGGAACGFLWRLLRCDGQG